MIKNINKKTYEAGTTFAFTVRATVVGTGANGQADNGQ